MVPLLANQKKVMAELFPSISNLIPALKCGDEITWNRLFDQFREGLSGKARMLIRNSKLQKKFSAEDLVQETLLKAWNGHESFAGETTAQFAGWVLTIMKNVYRDWFRYCKDDVNLSTWFNFSDQGETPSQVAISHEREAALHACLADLHPVHRQIVIWHHFEGLRFSEIAVKQNMNVNTVASHWRRGAAKLKKLMSLQNQ